MIQIKQDEGGTATSIKVDGIELSHYASEFSLTQKAGEIPELRLTISVPDMEVELPYGVTVVEREPPSRN